MINSPFGVSTSESLVLCHMELYLQKKLQPVQNLSTQSLYKEICANSFLKIARNPYKACDRSRHQLYLFITWNGRSRPHQYLEEWNPSQTDTDYSPHLLLSKKIGFVPRSEAHD